MTGLFTVQFRDRIIGSGYYAIKSLESLSTYLQILRGVTDLAKQHTAIDSIASAAFPRVVNRRRQESCGFCIGVCFRLRYFCYRCRAPPR